MDKMMAMVDRCMSEYDQHGWTVPHLHNNDDINMLDKLPEITQREVSMHTDEQRLRFRDAMASLSAAVNVVTTDGEAGCCGITATAVCSVTDTLPSLMVCINANSAMNPVFQGNGRLCVNVLNHEQEIMARHFAGMTGMTMEERFSLSCWQKGLLAQFALKGALAARG